MSTRIIKFIVAILFCGLPGLVAFALLWLFCFDPMLAAFIGCCVVGIGFDVIFNSSNRKK